MQALLALPTQFSEAYANGGKRLFDVVLVLLFAPLWLPVVACTWFMSWLEAGQGFYTDTRVGRGGAQVQCWKIRTMRRGLPKSCAIHKSRSDPRVTSFGRILRRSSLDKLPQLICVLKGEMSLVGPRPIPTSELHLYGIHQAQYLRMRPGLTGLWQVSGRNALPYQERVALDARYTKQPSLMKDIAILLATCREVWRMSGR